MLNMGNAKYILDADLGWDPNQTNTYDIYRGHEDEKVTQTPPSRAPPSPLSPPPPDNSVLEILLGKWKGRGREK